MNTASKVHRAMVDTAMARDFAALRALYHDDYTYTGPDGAERKGADAAVEVVETFTSAFPDYAAEIVHQYQPSEDVSILEYRATGTHQAELEGIPATNKRVEYPGCNIIEVRDGKIIREREYYDNIAIMQQLGIVDAP